MSAFEKSAGAPALAGAALHAPRPIVIPHCLPRPLALPFEPFAFFANVVSDPRLATKHRATKGKARAMDARASCRTGLTLLSGGFQGLGALQMGA